MFIRKASEQDLPKIKEVVNAAWYDTYLKFMYASTVTQFLEALYNDERLLKRLNDSRFLVAEEDDKIVGFINIINGKELYLAASYVDPMYQRRSIGSALLDAALTQFEEYEEAFVEVSLENKDAVRFYENRGFELLRSYDRDLYGEVVKTGLFKKRLK